MKKKRILGKQAIISAIALSVGVATSASAIDNAIKDPLFSLKEVGSQSQLVAHGSEGKCGENKCGEGKCGEGKCGEDKKAAVKNRSTEGRCGIKRIKRFFKRAEGKKSAEAKCGESKCGEGKCGSTK